MYAPSQCRTRLVNLGIPAARQRFRPSLYTGTSLCAAVANHSLATSTLNDHVSFLELLVCVFRRFMCKNLGFFGKLVLVVKTR